MLQYLQQYPLKWKIPALIPAEYYIDDIDIVADNVESAMHADINAENAHTLNLYLHFLQQYLHICSISSQYSQLGSSTAGLPMSYKLGPCWDGAITLSDFKSEAIFRFLGPNYTGKST